MGRFVPWIIGSCLSFLLSHVALAAERTAKELVVPSDQALAIMIKTTLIAYNEANLTGNYTVLRDLASPIFREANSSARLADIFQDMRRRRIDIAPIVLFQPTLLQKPHIDKDGDLLLEGFFDTRPERVEFLLVYRKVESLWRLFAIRVETKEMQAALAVPNGTAKPDASNASVSSAASDKPTSSEKNATSNSVKNRPASGASADINEHVGKLETAKPQGNKNDSPFIASARGAGHD